MMANNCSNDGDLRFSPLNSCILQICTEDKWTYVIKWELYGKKDQVLTVIFKNQVPFSTLT